MLVFDKLFIGGEWVSPATNRIIEVHSPHDQSLVGTAPEATKADMDLAVKVAKDAFDNGKWSTMAPKERQAVITKFNDLHAVKAQEFAELITSENGSPFWFTSMLQGSLQEQTNTYLRAAKDFAWENQLATGPMVLAEPVGVVAAVIPWNAPHQSALVKVIPALLAGNSVILKASPETALDALAMANLFNESGLPKGVLSIVPAHREASEYLVLHEGIDKIAFTGSTAAGKSIASNAAKQMKRVSLELGGKSAAIILEDADFKEAVAGLKFSSFANNAEACIALTRILVPRSRYTEFEKEMEEMVKGITVGDPMNMENFIGPMVHKAQQEKVKSYIKLGLEEGARLVVGGLETLEGLEQGNYVQPTLFADVDNSMRIAQEEIFGPVIVLIPYTDVEDAIRIANDSNYGLSGGVWSASRKKGLEVARRIRTGTVTVNSAASSFDAPFGGYKESGIGREFGGFGLGQYVEYKTINI
ncbi:aldehyde dehydrogenase [Peribacillus simplex]|uniref:aldehyde dehydrogenase n=1 Tax=Peribacillus simplex TaxID=1478 RepID=UPI0007779EE3|nr:aldehyde dehydrogenase [Peribacillus simplex]AMM95725.1 aldehyde dehydrogenase [Peribacillus simplex]MDM5291862.1 aldehyde dehydrogenase [Peribacillus simplex]